jgi:predicted nucleic acid-binding protein
MPFVLDASIAACWAFKDEAHSYAAAALARIRTDQAIAPTLWWFEIRNILVVNERRNRIHEADTAAFLRDIAILDVTLDFAPETNEVLRLSRAHHLSVYDAAYLELAMRNSIPLATLDLDLLQAANKEAVPIVGKSV